MTGNALLLVWLQKSRWLQQQQASGQQHQLLPVVGRLTEGKKVGELPLAAMEQQRRDVLGLQLQEDEQLGDELLLGQSRRVLCSLPSNAAAALHTHVLSCRA